MSAAHRDEIAKLESLYQENPEGRVFTHLAEAYRKAGEFDRAHEILSDGVRRHPDYSSAHVVRGRVLMDQDRTGEAAEAFRRVLELDPHNLIAVRSLAELARSRGDDAQAVEFYGRVLEQEPGDDEVREIVEELTGVRRPSMEATGRAEGSGRVLPLDDPADDAEVRTETIAQVYARQGLYDRAAEVYRELVRARPQDHALRDRLAEMEQLAEAQTGRGPEVDAVSDFDFQGPGPLDHAEHPEEPDDGDDFGLEGFESLETDRAADTFAVEGLESGEVDTTDVDAAPLAGLEVDEKDPDTGLRQDATPDTARPEEDLSETLDVRDVPEPPEEMPWEEDVSGGPISEPDWLAEVKNETVHEPADPETDHEPADSEPADESIWTGADWSDDTSSEPTPHAWTEPAEEDQVADTTPPVRAYFGDLLSWSGDAPTESGAGESAAGAQDRDEPAAPQSTGAAEPTSAPEPSAASQPSAAPQPTAAPEPEPGAAASPADDDDDDLDMFRSWLESLKQ